METFSELLSNYIRDAGISDTELARAIGVRRQTIFRWREGLTQRPRYREDVLVIAEKLRLTETEQNALLLAAGFQPETPARTGTVSLSIAEAKPPEATVNTPAPPPDLFTAENRRPIWQHPAGWIIGLVILLALAANATLPMNLFPWQAIPSPTATIAPTPEPKSAMIDIPPAQPGETVILVTQFANYAGEQYGYNIAGRLVEILEQEIRIAGLENTRVALWSEPTNQRRYALQAGQSVSATLVIYGEYDAGRVVAQFARTAETDAFIDEGLSKEVTGLQELSAAINTEFPQQVRSLALISLGQIFIGQKETGQAVRVLERARYNFENGSNTDTKTGGTLNFYLGVAYNQSQPPRLDEAIEAYTQALATHPELVSAQLNRSAAYLARNLPGDVPIALADANAVIAAAPNWATGFNNRATILMDLTGEDSLKQAEADLTQALTLNPGLASAYVNRAILYFRQGKSVSDWKPDLDAALELEPNRAGAHNMLCWGFAVENRPEVALPHCEQAIALEAVPAYHDSRGLALALTGDYPAAVADFEIFIDWLKTQSGEDQERTLRLRETWVTSLKTGESPFTPDVMAELRRQ